MSARREVLFLAHRIPYPPNKGDKIRSWRLLRHLAEKFDVHLGCFVDDPNDLQHTDMLRRMTCSATFVPLNPALARVRSLSAVFSGAPMSFAYFSDRRMRAFVEGARRRELAAEIAFSSSMAPYLAAPAGAPRLIDLCDADSEKWRDYANDGAGLMRAVYSREAARLATAETKMINWADVAFAISEAEARVLNARRGVEKPVLRVANGVDAEYFSPNAERRPAAQTADVVFVGAMDYRANVEAVLWFASEVWPHVRKSKHDATFAIVGARPTKRIRTLDGRDGIVATGAVEDVRPFLQFARVVIAPLRVARGVQNKVLEAMAMARPVVATTGANIGIDARVGDEILIADAPAEFGRAVMELLSDQSRGDRIGRAARARVIADFTWPARLAEFDNILQQVGAF